MPRRYEVDPQGPFYLASSDFSAIDDYALSDAEIAYGFTSLTINFGYRRGNVYRYGAVGDGTTDDTAACRAAIALSKGYFNATRSSSQRRIEPAYFPGGAYKCTTQIAIPDGACIKCDADAVFMFDDAGSGDYLFKQGVSGAAGGYVWIDSLYIVLKTVTAKGLWLLNCQHSRFDFIYVEGLVFGTLTSRTNIGVRLDATAGISSFLNRFGELHINHCHTGFYSPASGGFTGQQIFEYVKLYGDSVSGDTTSRGFDVEGCQDSVIHSGYIEAFPSTAGNGGIRLQGSSSVRWKCTDIVFDPGASTMNGIVISTTGGTPVSNRFERCLFPTNVSVSDATSAAAGNFIESNPNIAATWTATLVPQTSGTITLTAGAGGDQCFCTVRGKEVRVWGFLSVASVSAPTGRVLLRGLPFTIANSNSNYTACTIRCDGLNATAATQMQAFGNRNSTDIEIERYAAGAVSTGTAADFKAGSTIMFSMTYISA